MAVLFSLVHQFPPKRFSCLHLGAPSFPPLYLFLFPPPESLIQSHQKIQLMLNDLSTSILRPSYHPNNNNIDNRQWYGLSALVVIILSVLTPRGQFDAQFAITLPTFPHIQLLNFHQEQLPPQIDQYHYGQSQMRNRHH